MLKGKTAIVTGAANGMGASCARLFAAQGANVVLADIDAAGEEVAASIGSHAVFVRHDVAREDDWARLVELAGDRFGGLDILVNNAGVFDSAPLQETTVAAFERVFRVNQMGPFLGMRAVAPAMAARGGGSIINIVSVAAMSAHPNIFAYGTSKWAVRGMTRYAARDVGHLGIRVNSILPGVIETNMIAGIPRSLKDEWLSTMPLGRLGEPDDVGRVALFLASDLSAYMTGAELAVDAGQVA